MTDRARARTPLLILAALGALSAGAVVHAEQRLSERRQHEPAVTAVLGLLPSGDLSLAGGARYLRAPSLEEPGAAFTDDPGCPDQDPAGAAYAPPTDVYVELAGKQTR